MNGDSAVRTLGQAAGGGGVAGVLLAVAVLVAAVVALTVIVLYVRRRMFAPDGPAVTTTGVLEQLRRARDSGRISAEEYESARARLAPGVKREAGLVVTPGVGDGARGASGVGVAPARASRR